jgi:hypothetical protein
MFVTYENTERLSLFPKEQTQFTMLNKVLDPLASNINDSLTRVPCFFLSVVWDDFEQR